MPTTTTNYAFRKPVATDAADGPTSIGNLADDVDSGLLTQLNKIGKGNAFWGNRTTNSSTTTSEIGVLRIDNIPIVNGRAYRIWTSAMQLYSNITSDGVFGRLRGSTSGAATTASTQIGNDLRMIQTSTGTSFPESRTGLWLYNSTVTGSLSILLSVGRFTGTGNAQILGGMDLVVEDIGLAVADTGVDI